MSSLGVIDIIILSQFQDILSFLKYADAVGSIIIGLIILHTGCSIMKENIIILLGETEDNQEAESKIRYILSSYPELSYKDMDLERHGGYYVLELEVYVLKNIKVFQLLSIPTPKRKNYQRVVFFCKKC